MGRMIKAYKVSKNSVEFIDINENNLQEEIGKYITNSSSCVRYLKGFRFRCYCQDYVSKPNYFVAINKDRTADIPEICIMVLEDEYQLEVIEDHETLTINPFVESVLLENTFYYYDSNNKKQPVIMWN